VNSSQPTTRGQLTARWLAGASALLFTWFRFVPWGARTSSHLLDDSWIQVQHLAFLGHWQFGRDIVFTFGPWGFLLYGGYHPATYRVTLIAWLVLSVVFWWAAWRIAHALFENKFIAWFWLMIFTGTADLTVAWILLLLLVHFFAEDRPFSMIQALLVISLSLMSLTQFIIFVLTVMSVVAIGLDNILRQRRFPWILPVFAAGLLCFWIAAGQHAGNFGSYLRYSWQITHGYTEAMMLTGSNEAQDVCCFLIAAILVSVITGYAAWMRHRFFGIIPSVGVCFVLFTDFKYGYVRHDAHDWWAVKGLLLVALASVAVLWPIARKKGQWAVVASLVPTVAVFLFLSFTYRHDAESGLLPGIQGFSGPGELMGGGHLHEVYERHLADLRNQFPLPPIEGNIDAYPWNLDIIFAHGLIYHPRPVIQSFSAYTPELAQLNADFLRGENAPQNILIEGSSSNERFPPRDDGLTIDDRFPSLDDGLSWPELLTRYDVRDAEVSFVLLKRSPHPRQFHLVPLEDISVNFGEQIDVPSATNGPIWASIELNHTWWGAVISTLYKPPILLLNVSTRRERQPFPKRLVPGMARGGFLLSPLVEGCASFASLASTDAASDLSDGDVTSLMITAADGASAAACYQNPVRLRLFRLEYPRQNLEDVNGFRQLMRLEKALRRSQLLNADDMPQMVYYPGEGTILEVPRDSGILFAVPGGAKQLKVGFGIREWEKMGPRGAAQVVFRALAVDQQGRERLLWSQQLDPAAQKADRETQNVLIGLDGLNLSGIVLQTVSVEKNDGNELHSYWSKIDFE
jgi:hypothetical protein